MKLAQECEELKLRKGDKENTDEREEYREGEGKALSNEKDNAREGEHEEERECASSRQHTELL